MSDMLILYMNYVHGQDTVFVCLLRVYANNNR